MWKWKMKMKKLIIPVNEHINYRYDQTLLILNKHKVSKEFIKALSSLRKIIFFYTHNSYTIDNETKKTIPQGVCSTISTLRPTHIRDHSPFTQRLQRGGRVPWFPLKPLPNPHGGYATEHLARGRNGQKDE